MDKSELRTQFEVTMRFELGGYKGDERWLEADLRQVIRQLPPVVVDSVVVIVHEKGQHLRT